jgi:hypothetical protein
MHIGDGMATYPQSLRFFLNNISVQRQRFRHRLESPSADAVPNDTLILALPSTNVHLDSFSIGAELTTKAGGSGTLARLSKGTEALMQQIQVETNGTMIDPGCRFTNILADTLHDYNVDESGTPFRTIMQNAYTASPTGVHSAQPIVISSFTGFINTAQPRIMPCDLVPLRVHIRLADTKCLIADDPAATYTLSKLNVYYDTITIEDGGLFDAALREGLLKAPLEIPFDRWSSHSPGPGTLDNNTIVNINTESLDVLMGVIMDTTAINAPSALDSVTLKSQYFKRGVGTSNLLATSQFRVQGVPFPSWPNSPAEAFVHTAQNFGRLNDSVGGAASYLKAGDNANGPSALDAYTKSGFAHVFMFNYPNAEETAELRLRGGMNTSGTGTAGIEWETVSTGNSASQIQKVLFAKCTSVLLVGAGQQVQIRQ